MFFVQIIHRSIVLIPVCVMLCVSPFFIYAQNWSDFNEKVSLYHSKGKYDSAAVFAKIAIELAIQEFGVNHDNYASSLNDLAIMYRLLGRYQDAEIQLKKSIEVRKEIFGIQHLSYAKSLNTLGLLYISMGRFTDAEETLNQVLNIKLTVIGENDPSYGTSLNNLALLYRNTGRYEKAVPLYKKCLQVFANTLGTSHRYYAVISNNLAVVLQKLGNYDEAEILYNENIKRRELSETQKHPDYAVSLSNLSALYRNTKRYEEAERLQIKELEFKRNTFGSNHPRYANAVNNLAQLYRIVGRYEEAESLNHESLKIRKELLGENHPHYIISLNDLGLLYQKMGRYTDAAPLLTDSFNKILDNVKENFHAMSDKEKMLYWNTWKTNFEKLNTFAQITDDDTIRDIYVRQLFDNQLVTKGILMNASSKMKRYVQNSKDSVLIATYDLWVSERSNLVRALSQSIAKRKQDDLDIELIQEEINELEKSLSRKSAIFQQSYDERSYDWKDVQNALSPGEAAIESIRFRRYADDLTDSVKYAMLIIRADKYEGPELVVLENGDDMEGDLLNRYRKFLSLTQKDTISFNNYWEPIHKKLKGIEKVYFSSDGVFNIINLNTLFNSQTNKYLFDELDIQLVTSTKDIIQFSKPSFATSNLTALLIGDPQYDMNATRYERLIALNNNDNITRDVRGFGKLLESDKIVPLAKTGEEINSIAELLKRNDWEIISYLGSDALEENVKKVDNPAIMHIATHGYFDPMINEGGSASSAPTQLDKLPMMRSGLLLAGFSNYYSSPEKPMIEDGMLTAYESTTLKLDKTELVVLSACETGLGVVNNGEGVYGLQRGFKIAGAKSIMMSLWKVNDVTTHELMSSFYHEWLKTGDKRQAFRNAQKEIRKKFPKPIHWGGFVMVGDNTILEDEKPTSRILYMFAGILLIVILSIVLKRVFKSRGSTA